MEKDITKKRLEDYNDVFADIFNALLFEGKEILSEKHLIPLPTEGFSRRTDGRLRQGNRDVRKADIWCGHYRLILGEENQEGIDNTMPQRLMGYDFSSYEEQIKEYVSENASSKKPAITKRIHDAQKLAPVITMVLYWGAEEWKSPLRLHDMLEFPPETEKEIKPFVADYPMNLIQMVRLPEEVRERLKSDFRLLAEYVAYRNQPEKLKRMVLEEKQAIRHPEEFLDALSAVSGDRRYESIYEQVMERIKNEEEVTMCVLIDEFENRGVERGIEQGIEQGIEALILDNLEDGKTEIQILDKLGRRFSLSREKAEYYFHKYASSIS